jgi:hypothetical protein
MGRHHRPQYYRSHPAKAIVLEAQMRAEGWQDLKIAHYYEPIPAAPAYQPASPKTAPRHREHRARAHSRRGPPSDDEGPADPPLVRGRLGVA